MSESDKFFSMQKKNYICLCFRDANDINHIYIYIYYEIMKKQ